MKAVEEDLEYEHVSRLNLLKAINQFDSEREAELQQLRRIVSNHRLNDSTQDFGAEVEHSKMEAQIKELETKKEG